MAWVVQVVAEVAATFLPEEAAKAVQVAPYTERKSAMAAKAPDRGSYRSPSPRGRVKSTSKSMLAPTVYLSEFLLAMFDERFS